MYKLFYKLQFNKKIILYIFFKTKFHFLFILKHIFNFNLKMDNDAACCPFTFD
jgi:hypothetical protein